MTTLTYIGELEVTSCWCGIGVAIPSSLYREAVNNGKSIYCPLGHTFVWKETEVDRLKKELKRERDRLAAVTADRDQVSASLTATKGVVTRLRRKAIAGTCAFCHRHFVNMERHVATKHPTEAP